MYYKYRLVVIAMIAMFLVGTINGLFLSESSCEHPSGNDPVVTTGELVEIQYVLTGELSGYDKEIYTPMVCNGGFGDYIIPVRKKWYRSDPRYATYYSRVPQDGLGERGSEQCRKVTILD